MLSSIFREWSILKEIQQEGEFIIKSTVKNGKAALNSNIKWHAKKKKGTTSKKIDFMILQKHWRSVGLFAVTQNIYPECCLDTDRKDAPIWLIQIIDLQPKHRVLTILHSLWIHPYIVQLGKCPLRIYASCDCLSPPPPQPFQGKTPFTPKPL